MFKWKVFFKTESCFAAKFDRVAETITLLKGKTKHTIKHHIYFILNTAKYKEYLGQTH